MTQYSTNTPNEVIHQVSHIDPRDSEEMRIEGKLFNKVQEQGVSYN